MNYFKKLVIPAILVISVLVFFFPHIVIAYTQNELTIVALKTAFSQTEVLNQTALDEFSQQSRLDCRLLWLMDHFQTYAQQQKSYSDTFVCSLEYLHIATKSHPIDQELALQATRLFPKSVDAWLWLGFAEEYAKANTGLAAYQNAAALDSHNGQAWCAIGQIDERLSQVQLAEDAYLNCCKNQDTDGAGCYGAGRMAEKSGNPQLAIQYYRLSSYDNALSRASELEKTLP